MLSSQRTIRVTGGVILASLLVLGIDLLTPAGVAGEMLQVVPVLLTLWLPGRKSTILVGIWTGVLVVCAAWLGPRDMVGSSVAMIHALFALVGIFLAVLVVLQYKETERALQETEAKAQAILETTAEGVITIDSEGNIQSFNSAAEDIFGYTFEEVVGEKVNILMPEPYKSEHDDYMNRYLDTGEPHIIGIGREVVGERKDGSTFPLDLSVSEVEVRGERLFTGIVRDISENRRLQKEVLRVGQEERRRIGQDLHDQVGQMLSGLQMISETLAERLRDEGSSLADQAERISHRLREADAQIGQLVKGLVPVEVEGGGLIMALRRLASETEEFYEIACEFREQGGHPVDDQNVATNLYRIAQEAVGNAARHANASKIRITLSSGVQQIRLQIRDDGTGFPDTDLEDHEDGLGLRTMDYRARIMGGTLDLRNDPDEGAVVVCTVPRSALSAPTPAEVSA